MNINPKDYVNERLSMGFRDGLISSIRTQTFKKREARIAERKKALLTEAFQEALPEVFKMLLTKPGVEKDWFEKAQSIDIREGSEGGPLLVRGYFTVPQAAPKTFFSHYHSSRVVVVLDALPGNLKSALKRFVKAEDSLEKDKKELKDELRKIIYAANTTRQLITAWPEITKHHPFPKVGDVAHLPAVIPTKLNTMLSQMGQDAA